MGTSAASYVRSIVEVEDVFFATEAIPKVLKAQFTGLYRALQSFTEV
jgi:hypothetical protein